MRISNVAAAFAVAVAAVAWAVPASAVIMNVAPFGVASQSSTRNGSATDGDVAVVAIDRNTNGAFGGGSVTHTNSESNPFWQVDLGTERSIDDITVWNRTDGCCDERINGYTLSVLDSSMSTVFSTTPADPNSGGNPVNGTTNAGGVSGQFVRIDLPGAAKTINIAEVQVFSDVPLSDPILRNGRNLAREGTASQTTTATFTPKGNLAILGIDGNRDGAFGNGGVTHTLNAPSPDPNPAWTVDLGSTKFIDNINLWERTDAGADATLNGATVSVLDSGLNTVYSTVLPSFPGDIHLAVPFPVQGQFVRVDGIGNVQLAEVEVYGGEQMNIARNPLASASQTSTRTGSGGNAAGFAVDGNTDGIFNNGSVTHTDTGDLSPTWTLDLGQTGRIDDILVWNRTDCCPERIDGYEVRILDENMVEVFSAFPARPAPEQHIFVGGIFGQFVEIALPAGAGGTLSLAEVQVFGSIPEPATGLIVGLLGLLLPGLSRRRRRA